MEVVTELEAMQQRAMIIFKTLNNEVEKARNELIRIKIDQPNNCCNFYEGKLAGLETSLELVSFVVTGD